MKKTAVKGLFILIAVALVCVFFSGTLHSITTAKVQMTKAKTGKLTSEISMSVLDIIKVISLPLSSYQIINNVIPDIDYDTDLTTMIDEHGEWIWVYDLEAAGNRIVDIINNQ